MDLREIDLFKNLSEEDLVRLSKDVSFEERTYKKGETIFNWGDITKDLFYLREGKIAIYNIDSKGKRFILESLDKPMVFGEIYVYLNLPFDFYGEAMVDSKIIIIRDFKKIIEASPRTLLLDFIDLLARKTLSLSKKNQISSSQSLRQKISKVLLENEINNKVDLTMTREELADYLSVTRPSLSRELSNMVDSDLIEIDGRNIYIINKEEIIKQL
ncbi:Crp/Fnr family transcriptional regulator [Anaerococcus sp. AGMB09787]|uniref:Crp/Fnr family transcriptional regulator n=1 Tax=Anaerococcus sp. AGMB09787 TaxID=2922869 RepID=UPI001FAF8F87|nr:Crp/Fnr family transcriptional regulator [Anaerococcus sp. AGMB09787]